MKDTSSALVSIDKLTGEFPDSYYSPYGMKIKADILLEKPESVEQAATIYRLLLEKYPNYPFISDVRKKMRQMNLI